MFQHHSQHLNPSTIEKEEFIGQPGPFSGNPAGHRHSANFAPCVDKSKQNSNPATGPTESSKILTGSTASDRLWRARGNLLASLNLGQGIQAAGRRPPKKVPARKQRPSKQRYASWENRQPTSEAWIVCVKAAKCGGLSRCFRLMCGHVDFGSVRKGGSRLDRCDSAESASGIPLSLTSPEYSLRGRHSFAAGERRLANLKAGHSDDRQDGRSDPKPHDDLDFVLSPEQVMIVQRAAGDNAFARQLEPADLQPAR